MNLHALGLLHPEFVARGNFGFQPAQINYLRRLKRWVDKPGAAPPTLIDFFGELPSPALLDPTYDEAIAWLDSALSRNAIVSYDIESAGEHVRLIGIMEVDTESYLAIHIRRQYGQLRWKRDKLRNIVIRLDMLHERCPLVFHNGQAFDAPELEAVGFEGFEPMFLAGGDTLVMQRHAYVDAPANLQYCAITYCGFSAWKHMVKVGDEEQEDK